MHIDKNSRVVVLPSPGSYQVIEVPSSRDLSQKKSMLIQNGQLMEINEIKGTPKSSMPKLNNGGAVKSLLFEGANADIPGFVLQSPLMLVGTPFNIVYLMISIMYHNQDVFTKRFITLEDVIDQLGQIHSGEWVTAISNEQYVASLAKVCEMIDENGEQFYKFSLEKAVQFIKSKVEALKAHFDAKKEELSLYNTFKQQVLDPTNDSPIPSEVIDQLTLKSSINFVCDSYLTGEFKARISEGHNFDEVENWIAKVENNKKSLEVVEESLKEVVKTTTKANRVQKKAKVTKKVVKKVAVGKGALDGFFKKN
ncbi:uncharacterized protein CANTADRAFT_4320 [Suhomyces tanzawaensis NRRL Y-17324]|uniref:Ribonuclease H2 subunit B n=1 Tax=Suhomyces tanzawaensis NRRL Y-17324 TaxID=984487 RepID=A0A1E4SS13_9ASCO|nr:uncharacterized protein CANTADRAFT_4320 [Suhomyces tanzawaensis NRRL Y-17324]ODV82309.1 hypothetical protein CANTADRAFT_4320 [Suhomyces tanzawaensis NRRL Y-17324]